MFPPVEEEKHPAFSLGSLTVASLTHIYYLILFITSVEIANK